MTNIRLQNPYMDETIKVKENLKRISDMLQWLEVGNIQCLQWRWWNVMNELDYVKSMFDKYISECENLSKEPPNGWTESAANKSKIKRLGIELRQEMIDLERKYYV